MNLKKFTLLFCIIVLSSCTSKNEQVEVIAENDIELQMIEFYKKGKKALSEDDVLYAAKMFNEAELLYPQSEWASKSSLMAAYAYYSQSYYPDAIFELERFLKIYKKNKDQDYAHYLLALCYYEMIVDEKKDLEPLNKAKEQFEFIIKNYPESDFAIDSKFKIDLVLDVLAAKEIYIGKHYIKDRKWIAAINRFKYVVENYETTIHVEEALFRLVEIHYRLGLLEEAKRYTSILGYNYKSSQWYEQSYIIFNPQYISRKDKIKKEKKRSKNFLIKKIKNLFK
tara:strand:- start:4602 stop:5447 length:846 start_codon:yes stop_codon:yes gene_type:complete